MKEKLQEIETAFTNLLQSTIEQIDQAFLSGYSRKNPGLVVEALRVKSIMYQTELPTQVHSTTDNYAKAICHLLNEGDIDTNSIPPNNLWLTINECRILCAETGFDFNTIYDAFRNDKKHTTSQSEA